jgi:lantibiotic leader peptide-processing serine protease
VSSKAFALAGVTSKTTLIGVKVLGANGSGAFGGILAGILYAADQGADVANMSLGASFSKALGDGAFAGLINRVVNYANQQGMLIVVAAGNESSDLDHDGNTFNAFCSAANVMCVSAVGQETPTGSPDVPAFYSNFGRSAITVAAPGGAAALPLAPVPGWAWGTSIGSFVWSFCSKTTLESDTLGVVTGRRPGCINGGSLTGMIGTSQASPHVAGLAALLMAEMGTGKPSQIKHAIIASADDLGQPGTDPFYGKGRINVARALSLE